MPEPGMGRCAVSCSKSFNAKEYGAFVQRAAVNLPPEDFERLPAWGDVKNWPGKIVGCCDYEADMCRMKVRSSSDTYGVMWDEGYRYWWNLSNVVCFDRPIPCRGNVGMWQMPPSVASQVSATDELAACVGERVATAKDAERLFRLAIPVAWY